MPKIDSTMPVHSFYVAHAMPFSVNGKTFTRGDVLRGADALAFEKAVANGETNDNNATPVAVDPEA